MARLSKSVVVERECFVFELFKTGASVKEANESLLLKYGTKMGTARLCELRKTAVKEVFSGNKAVLESLLDPDGYKFKNTIADLQAQIRNLQETNQLLQNAGNDISKELENSLLPTRSQPEDLADLERAYSQNQEMAIKIQELENEIVEVKNELKESNEANSQKDAKIENCQDEIRGHQNEIAELESKIENLETQEEHLNSFEKFIEEICDRKAIPVRNLLDAIYSEDMIKACKIVLNQS